MQAAKTSSLRLINLAGNSAVLPLMGALSIVFLVSGCSPSPDVLAERLYESARDKYQMLDSQSLTYTEAAAILTSLNQDVSQIQSEYPFTARAERIETQGLFSSDHTAGSLRRSEDLMVLATQAEGSILKSAILLSKIQPDPYTRAINISEILYRAFALLNEEEVNELAQLSKEAIDQIAQTEKRIEAMLLVALANFEIERRWEAEALLQRAVRLIALLDDNAVKNEVIHTFLGLGIFRPDIPMDILSQASATSAGDGEHGATIAIDLHLTELFAVRGELKQAQSRLADAERLLITLGNSGESLLPTFYQLMIDLGQLSEAVAFAAEAEASWGTDISHSALLEALIQEKRFQVGIDVLERIQDAFLRVSLGLLLCEELKIANFSDWELICEKEIASGFALANDGQLVSEAGRIYFLSKIGYTNLVMGRDEVGVTLLRDAFEDILSVPQEQKDWLVPEFVRLSLSAHRHEPALQLVSEIPDDSLRLQLHLQIYEHLRSGLESPNIDAITSLVDEWRRSIHASPYVRDTVASALARDYSNVGDFTLAMHYVQSIRESSRRKTVMEEVIAELVLKDYVPEGIRALSQSVDKVDGLLTIAYVMENNDIILDDRDKESLQRLLYMTLPVSEILRPR